MTSLPAISESQVFARELLKQSASGREVNRLWELDQRRDVCEIKYAYTEFDSRGLDASEYWGEFFSLADKYR